MMDMGNQTYFASAILDGLNAPHTEQNLDFLFAWFAREGTAAKYNPLATTLSYGGGSNLSGNSAGVKNYPDFQTGVAATVETLLHSGYSDIVEGLRSGNGAWNASAGLSRWSGSGYSSLTSTAGVPVTGGAADAGSFTAAGAGDSGAPPTVDPKQYAQEKYGYLAAYLDDGEIGPLIIQAAQEGWDINRLQGALYSTNWWQTHADTARQWDALINTDHATADQRINNQMAIINQMASEMGVSISNDRNLELADHSIRWGWTGDVLKRMVAHEGKYNPNALSAGTLGSTQMQVKAMAADYMIPFADNDAFTWAQQIVGGEKTIDGAKAMMENLALGRFPHLADILKSGVTPGQYFAPYRQLIAQQLEVSPDSIDLLNNPTWLPVTSMNDGGTIRPMTLSETAKLARMQPGYKGTAQGQQQAASTAEFIDKTFGRVA